MAYKIKHKRMNAVYWDEREYENVRKKYHNKMPPFTVVMREATRTKFSKAQAISHRKGAFVEYQGNPSVVTKVTRKGVWIQSFKRGSLGVKATKKPIFIAEKKYEQKVEPYSTSMPIVSSNTGIFNFEKI
jgi:hypothetical protein